MDNIDRESRSFFLEVVLDFGCIVFVGLPILILYVAGTPYERGFFCDDESLKHPYLESTVPSWTLYVFGLGLPILSIASTEFVLAKWSNSLWKATRTFRSYPLPDWTIEVYRHVAVFGFGAACSQLTTDIAKYTIGRLRPHFFDVCNPNVNCRDPTLIGVYITRFQCMNQNARLLKDMRLSFPSGHSSFSVYCMLFLAMYLHAKMTWRGSRLLKHIIQYVAVILAAYTALTRISDYKHHWSDVLSGVVIGVIVAVVIVAFVSDLFPAGTQDLHVPPQSTVYTNSANSIEIDNLQSVPLPPNYNNKSSSQI